MKVVKFIFLNKQNLTDDDDFLSDYRIFDLKKKQA